MPTTEGGAKAKRKTPSAIRPMLVGALTAAAVALAVCPSALAAFPGVSGRIVYESGSRGEILAINADGAGQVNLTNNAAIDLRPAFSPDGQRIAFGSFRDGNLEIYVMTADGSGPVRRLTHDPAIDLQPTFSPDGETVAFASGRDGNAEVYAINADGSGPVRRLTESPASDFEPAFSPDGRRIAFQSDRDGNAEIYAMNANGSGQVNVTNNPASDAEPAFSPDGQQIAFTSTRDGFFDIYVMNADGSGQASLTGNTAAADHNPDWGAAYTPCQGRAATIAGTDGGETITATPGPDVIAGLGGNDTIRGLGGADAICGGAGADIASYAGHELNVTATIGGGSDDGSTEDGPPGARDSIGADIERLIGGFGDDFLSGSSRPNVLTGGPGNDTLNGRFGNDQLAGSSGDDTLRGAESHDRLSGHSGADTLAGGEGDDVLVGASGPDTLPAGEGDDVLRGTSGDDTLAGGEGDDSLDGGVDADLLVGGPGSDRASYAPRVSRVVATIGAGAGNDGGAEDGPLGFRDTLAATIERLNGGKGPDSLTGNGLANVLVGGLGSDRLSGLAGVDTLRANDGVADLLIDCGPGADRRALFDAGLDPTPLSCG